jgi:hypothetical protein
VNHDSIINEFPRHGWTIMRYGKFLFLAPLLAVGACDDDGISVVPLEPAAVVRFVNVNADTGMVDLRFIDRVENLPTFMGVGVRGNSGVYQRVRPGARPAVIFPTSDNINLTSIRLVEQTVGLQVDNRYTLVYAGRAGAGVPESERHRLVVFEEAFVLPTPGAESIALQVIHAAAGIGNVDVYVVPVTSATEATPNNFAAAAVEVFRNVAHLGRSAYATVPRRPAEAGRLYRFVVTPAGTPGTVLFASTPNQPGIAQPAAGSHGPQPGMQIGRSVLTAVLSPGTVPGTRGSTAANQTPGVIVLVDKPLDRVE